MPPTASEIPTEILGEILFHAIDSPVSTTQGHLFPWTIGRVCKTWRHAFVTYPVLWTSFSIDLSESHPNDQDWTTISYRVALCLERSKDNPLSISLSLPEQGFEKLVQRFNKFFRSLLLSCSHRWRDIAFMNIMSSHLIDFDPCERRTSVLESLIISSTGHVSIPFSGFNTASRLTRFAFQHPGSITVTDWSINWKQLTHLMLKIERIIGLDEVRILVKQLHNIEELRFAILSSRSTIDIDDFLPESEAPALLTQLRTLEVPCPEIIALVNAPSLSHLSLAGSSFFYPWDDGSDFPDYVLSKRIIDRFIKQSSCIIRKLTLCDFSSYPFAPLVGSFPDVEELCVADAPACLGSFLLSCNTFPNLRVLRVSSSSHCNDHNTALNEIFELRNGPSSDTSIAALDKIIFRLKQGESPPGRLQTVVEEWEPFNVPIQFER